MDTDSIDLWAVNKRLFNPMTKELYSIVASVFSILVGGREGFKKSFKFNSPTFEGIKGEESI